MAAFSEAKANDRGSFYVKSFFDDDGALGELGEVVETVCQVFFVAIDVEMVSIDGVDNANIGGKM